MRVLFLGIPEELNPELRIKAVDPMDSIPENAQVPSDAFVEDGDSEVVHVSFCCKCMETLLIYR